MFSLSSISLADVADVADAADAVSCLTQMIAEPLATDDYHDKSVKIGQVRTSFPSSSGLHMAPTAHHQAHYGRVQ